MSELGSAPLQDRLDTWLDDHLDDLIAFRRDLHAHPELSGDEHRTTAAVTDRLGRSGYEARPLSVGTGAIIDSTSTVDDVSSKLVAIRADLDALAMHDLKDVDYRSRIDGVAHACGHDVHTTIAVGVAEFVSAHPDLVERPVRFIFQPAEERVPGGALDVLRDAGLDGVDEILGLHCEPKLDVGTIGLRVGAITSAADMVSITVRGPGGHTARPELTVDTVALAAKIIAEVPDAVRSSTGESQVKMVFGAVHGGDAANAIPTSVLLRASVRTPSLDVWETLEEQVRAAVNHLVDRSGAEVQIDYVRGVPPTVNDQSVIARVRAAAEATSSVDTIVDAEQSWGGDDFAWLAREVPGAYIRLGVRSEGSDTLDLHAGRFDVDEGAVGIGIRLLVAALCEPDPV